MKIFRDFKKNLETASFWIIIQMHASRRVHLSFCIFSICRNKKSVGTWWSCFYCNLHSSLGCFIRCVFCCVSYLYSIYKLCFNFPLSRENYCYLQILMHRTLNRWFSYYIVLICDCRYDHSTGHAVFVVLSVTCVHFLLVGAVLATICW